jgi:sterol desaturase/sphingolipid hydroxylase (fatty acid hydroxylase superfamily)
METINAFFGYVTAAPFDMNVRYSIFYLLCSVVIAFGIWLYRGRPETFVKWLVPKAVYSHKSNILDIKLFLASRAFMAFGIFSAVFFPTTVAYTLLMKMGGADFAPPPVSANRILVATLIIVVASDFCKYWAHRAHHEWKILWPFHAVHHSADVLTPLTVQRVHPVEPLIRNALITLIVGLVQGIILYAVLGQLSIATIAGANAIYFLFNALGANFRHSHIWISYGRVMEHILISPAQHQVHHSVATKHHDKNYGSIFAIWDWMFGTLYVPEKVEDLTFGCSDGTGKPMAQPYPTLRRALIGPFIDSGQAIRRALSRPTDSTREVTPSEAVMSQGFSLWLDAVRAGAALTVLFGHMAHVRFTDGDY